MFLINRRDNVTIERTTELERALILAQEESVKRENTRIDVIEHWIEWAKDVHVASYRDGHLIPLS